MSLSELHAKCDAVVDRETFFAFLAALVAHRCEAVRAEARDPAPPYGPDAGGWENTSIEHYLDSCLAWGKAASLPEEPSWQSFAEMLCAGVIYE